MVCYNLNHVTVYVKESGELMEKLEMLGYFWIFISMSLSIGLYKLEISKRVIDEEYEYIKRHRAFGNLTKYLVITAIISIVLLNCKFLIDRDYLFVVVSIILCKRLFTLNYQTYFVTR